MKNYRIERNIIHEVNKQNVDKIQHFANKDTLLQFWSKAFLDLTIEHKDYWRARLVTWVLMLSCLFFFVLFIINAFYFKALNVSIIDAVGFIASFSLYYSFRKSANIDFACWATTLLVIFILMLFIVVAGGYAHSLFWATLIPPIAFFLLGSRWGTIISMLCFSACICIVYLQIQSQTEVTFGTGALLNTIEVSIAHILIFRFYEHSRASAYKQLITRNEQIFTLSETDKLTQLFNRDKLDSALIELTDQSKYKHLPLSMIIIDIDHFKKINDEYGHLVGDKVLVELAARLKSLMRKDDLLFRWGGEEFVILLQNTTLETAAELSERLRIQVTDQAFGGHPITTSTGVGEYIRSESTDAFFDRVDEALYEAKRDGRNRVATAI